MLISENCVNWDVENVKKGMKSVDNGKIWRKEGKYGKILFEITEITTNLLLAELALICHQNLYDDIPILSRIRAPKLDLYCLFPAAWQSVKLSLYKSIAVLS